MSTLADIDVKLYGWAHTCGGVIPEGRNAVCSGCRVSVYGEQIRLNPAEFVALYTIEPRDES